MVIHRALDYLKKPCTTFVSCYFYALEPGDLTICLIGNCPYIIRQCPALTQPGRVRGCSMVCRFRQLRGYRDVPGPNPGGGIYCKNAQVV